MIPLLMIGPGVPAGAVERNVSLVDLVPTLAEATGVDVPNGDGCSLFDASDGRAILAEGIAYGHEKTAVIDGDRKLLHSPLDGYERVFALGPDRMEAGTIDDPLVAARLREHVPTGESAMGEQVESSPEILEHLRALGYIK